jgi:4-carboxymuconolactone decarboxylase
MAVREWVWHLVDLTAAQAAGDTAGMDKAFERLRAAGRESEVEEALLQSYLFLGFPSAIEALRRWRTNGTATPEAADENWEEWLERGQRTCAIVYGDHYEQLRKNIARFHPDLDLWMVAEGYGKILSRPALSLDIREMLIVTMLVVQVNGGRRQLRSHLKGALNAGVTPEDVVRTIERAAKFASPAKLDLARKLWTVVNNGD